MSDILDPIAAAIGVRAEAVGAKFYKWAPTDIKPPCLVVELPSLKRTPVDQKEDHLGATDWYLDYPAIFYFALDNPDTAQPKAVDIIEAFVLAIDADNGLGGICQEAKVVEVMDAEMVDDQPNAVIRWPTRVEVLTFV